VAASDTDSRRRGVNAPEIGQLVTIRDRQWVVADVSRGSQETDVLSGNGPVAEHLVSLVSVEDDAMGDEIQVIWELEPGRAIVDQAALPAPDPDRFDKPERIDAFLDAIRWGASADPVICSRRFAAGSRSRTTSSIRLSARFGCRGSTC
jgi:hypothetical protein